MPRGNLLFVSVLPIIALALYYGASINGWAARTQGILGFESRTAALDQTCSSCSKSLKPPIIVAAIPHWSHVEKLIQLADGLVKKGYHVTFLGSPAMRQEIERSGSTFEAIDGTSSIPGKIFSDAAEETMKNLRHRGVEGAILGMSDVFVDTIPNQFRSSKEH